MSNSPVSLVGIAVLAVVGAACTTDTSLGRSGAGGAPAGTGGITPGSGASGSGGIAGGTGGAGTGGANGSGAGTSGAGTGGTSSVGTGGAGGGGAPEARDGGAADRSISTDSGPLTSDAGAGIATDGSAAPDASAGCPAIEPQVGSTCTVPGLVCEYAPGICCGHGATCTGGVWQTMSAPCPCPTLSTGGAGGGSGASGTGGRAGTGGSGIDGGVRTSTMVAARTKHAATLLANGRVLITGGGSEGPFSATALSSAEIYDPATGKFTATAGSMVTARMGHTATLLPSGKVLIAGAKDSASAELFDPATGTFTATGNMTAARRDHTATLLDNGKVLIAGGAGSTAGLASAELFDPATGTFTPTGNLTEARYQHAAALLANKKVLLVGGYVTPAGLGNNEGLMTAELYDAATGAFTATGTMGVHRALPTATVLPGGSVLVAGGPDGFEGYFASDVLELYEPSTGKFTTTGPLVEARALHTATLLSTGSVLFVGGYQGGGGFGKYLDTTESYAPTTASCTAGASLAERREYHTATALSDGRVLIVGGDASGKSLSSAELYQ